MAMSRGNSASLVLHGAKWLGSAITRSSPANDSSCLDESTAPRMPKRRGAARPKPRMAVAAAGFGRGPPFRIFRTRCRDEAPWAIAIAEPRDRGRDTRRRPPRGAFLRRRAPKAAPWLPRRGERGGDHRRAAKDAERARARSDPGRAPRWARALRHAAKRRPSLRFDPRVQRWLRRPMGRSRREDRDDSGPERGNFGGQRFGREGRVDLASDAFQTQ